MTTPIKIRIPAGIDNEDADYSKTPKWVDCDKIRFRKGYPQKIGGWVKQTITAAEGVIRGYIAWRSHDYSIYSGLGTSTRVYIESGGDLNDITPIRDSGTLGTDPFAVVDTSTTVTVTHTAHGNAVNDIVLYSGATAGGGITVDGEYTVDSVVDANTYTITHSSAATSTDAATGGASVAYTYYMPVGNASTTFGLGWGAGKYSENTYGTPRPATTPVTFSARTWSFALWGEDLIFNPRGENVYVWDASAGTGTRGTIISAAPASNSIVVSSIDRHMIAYGCEETTGSGTIDPLLIRWSDQEDYTDWTPSATNTSGTKRLQNGSSIIGAINTRTETLVFTNETVTSQRYIGTPFTFGFQEIGTNCGLIGSKAVVNHGSTTFWMSERNFYVYDGTLKTLRCPVHKHVFDNLNYIQKDKFFAGLNSQFHEVWWFYCSADAEEIDSYVIYNYEQNAWSYGTMVRTAWIDHGVRPNPAAAGIDGYIYDHETGVDDDGAAIIAYLESGEFEFPPTDETGPGEYFVYMDKLIPDYNLTGLLELTLKTRRYPNDTEISKGPYTLTPTTTKRDFRIRGRQWAVRWGSSGVGDDWRLGDQRFQIRPAGKR